MSVPISKLNRINAIGVAGVLLLSAAAYFLGIAPLVQRIASDQDAAAELADHQHDAAKIDAALAAAKRRSIQTAQQLAATPVKLQSADMINDRMVRLTKLASQHGVKLDQLSPGVPGLTGRFTTVPIRLSGSTTFPALVAFIADFNRRFAHTGITTLHLSGTPTAQDNATPLAFSMDCVWYAAPAGSAASAAVPTQP